jgi:glucose-1-phosphate thymidylyltransferase
MKAIIPVAGIGTRLRPHTHTQPKALIPVAGKPILAHIVDTLVAAGYDEFVFVIGYLGDKIEAYITDHYPKVKSHFVLQTSGKGVGYAIWLTRKYVDPEEDVFIVFGDTIFDADMKAVHALPCSSIGLKKVEDPRLFGVAETDAEGFITKVIEKPSIPKSNQALVGLYFFRKAGRLMDALNHLIEHNIRTQNEFLLTDAISYLIGHGEQFKSFPVDNWFDCGKKEVLLETNSTLLKRMSLKQDFSRFENTVIIPPVHIAESSRISNSIIGPDVSIGEDTIVDYSIIRNSIIGPYAHLENAILLDSLVGNDSVYKGMVQTLNLGDSTEINFGK